MLELNDKFTVNNFFLIKHIRTKLFIIFIINNIFTKMVYDKISLKNSCEEII